VEGLSTSLRISHLAAVLLLVVRSFSEEILIVQETLHKYVYNVSPIIRSLFLSPSF
jgi:hypothetical protein